MKISFIRLAHHLQIAHGHSLHSAHTQASFNSIYRNHIRAIGNENTIWAQFQTTHSDAYETNQSTNLRGNSEFIKSEAVRTSLALFHLHRNLIAWPPNRLIQIHYAAVVAVVVLHLNFDRSLVCPCFVRNRIAIFFIASKNVAEMCVCVSVFLASHDVHHSVSNKSKLMRFLEWTKC